MKTLRPQSLQIRALQRHELDHFIGWAAQEGWNPGLHDSESFHATDPEGFLVGEVNGQAVSMISAVRYGSSFGFIGFYIVRPDMRGRGYGLATWNAGMQRLAGRLVGLDGVVDQQANYRQSGFVLAYNNMRMQGAARAHGLLASGLRTLQTADLESLLQYDAAMFPAERAAFLRHWLQQTGSVAIGLQDQGTWRGYGVIRPCRQGYKIGPLFADDAARADQLVDALMARVPQGAQVQWDMSCEHAQARALATARGMQPVFETARMYTGPAPAFDLQRQFGITSFELG